MAVIEEEPSFNHNSKPQSRPFAVPNPSEHNSDGLSETGVDTEMNGGVAALKSHSDNLQNNSDKSCTDGKDVGGVINGVEEEELQQESESSEAECNKKALSQANEAKLEGNAFFKSGSYDEALSKYELAIQIVPDGPSSAEIQSICYSNRAACFSKLEKHEETVKECTKALELNPKYTKALLRRAEAREKLEQYEESIADMTKVLELDPSNDQARRTIICLKPLADEKREKMKEEMIGKLKEMGNSILGRFGMSVDNFKAVKDPNTGSYSISFQQ